MLGKPISSFHRHKCHKHTATLKISFAQPCKTFDLHSQKQLHPNESANHRPERQSKRTGGQLSILCMLAANCHAQTSKPFALADRIHNWDVRTGDIITKGLTRSQAVAFLSRDNREPGKGICWWNFNCLACGQEKQAPLIIAVEVRKIRGRLPRVIGDEGRSARLCNPS
jgi:hypothetical protein